MHSRFRTRGATLAGLLVLALAALTPSLAEAKPEPGAKRGFRLFARPLGAMTINRVLCGLTSTGNICVDSLNSSTIGGGFWPKGTADQYVFNTGLQLAGIVGADGGPWAGDTTGAFFFDPKGTTEHGIQVRPIYNSSSPDDVADWPAAARVPCSQAVTALCSDPALGGVVGDVVGDIYSPLLQGRVAGSQGDTWFMSWEGDPSLNAGRPHPLGIVAETRGLGWNFPSGNEDIVYFVYTFYNVTTLNRSDYEATIRPAMVDVLEEQATSFHALNNARFSVTLPTSGYTIDPLYAAFATDMDVTTDAGSNYASVNLPFATGDTYHESFPRPAVWTFDPAIFSAPFFAGSGFVGVKYLQSPTGPGEIQLYGNTINGGAFGDAQNTTQLYRYLSGNISTAAGDAPCNNGDPTVTKVCFVNNAASADMRFFQSSTPLTLAPGGFGSIVVAYLFAAPVDGVVPSGTSVAPGDVLAVADPTRAGNPALVPDQQKMAGYISWSDVNGNSVVEQDEFVVVPGSLLGKALTAQAVFDAKFLLPFAPDAPDFFLIPGDNSVTVMWRQSPTELPGGGDPFFNVAKDAQIGGSVNPLYDANYRQFDVEGYRVYRGRVNAPNELTMIGQFDYAGTTILDFGGQVDYGPQCAPELGLVTACPVAYNPADFAPGIQRTINNPVDLNQSSNTLNQVKFGERTLLADGTAIVLTSDTAVVGLGGSCAPSPCLPLSNTGVPFILVDNNVRNNFRYFYAVTAFDVNSWQSGPTNLESPRITKAVVPTKPATNYENTADLRSELFGRGPNPLPINDPLPTIDPTTGVFSGPMPPSNAWSAGFQDFVKILIAGPGQFAMKLDSVVLGDAYRNIFGGIFDPGMYHFTATAASGVFKLALPLPQSHTLNPDTAVSSTFVVTSVDPDLAARYGGDGGYDLFGQASMWTHGPYMTNGTGRGAAGFGNEGGFNFTGQIYDGPRWFEGPNETFADPTQGNCTPNCTMTNFNNGGQLTGVATIHQHYSYTTQNFSWRGLQGKMGAASRAADMQLWWGPGGTVDSVVDITHDVLIPFQAHAGGSWGFLNFNAQTGTGSYDQNPALLTDADMGCVEPIYTDGLGSQGPVCTTGGGAFLLSNTAVPGPMGLFTTRRENSRTAVARPNAGIALYIAGNLWMFELAGGALPAAGTMWTLRDYIGGITGGNGDGGPRGPYGFVPAHRTLSAVGTEIRVQYDVVNQVNRVTADDLANVHPVPDPYYITSDFDRSPVDARIEFINLPQQAIIRIYSSSGVLVDLIEHNSDQAGGSAEWNVRNRNNQVIASGVYFYHVESNDQRRVGRMTIVRFAQ